MDSILIVDDDQNLCEVLSEELREIGYETDSVNGALDAVRFASGHPDLDLILLDLKLPDEDGFYVLRTLKEKNFPAKIIVITAYADVKSAMDSSRLGAVDFISKPYDLDELIIAIRKALQKEPDENKP